MLDVIIPSTASDLDNIPIIIECLMANLSDGLGKVFVVSNGVKEVGSVEFINEAELVGFTKNSFNIGIGNRNGWVFQQLIKLSGDKVSTTDDFLVLDADHFLLKPHKFVDGGKYKFYTSSEYHHPYFSTMDRLFCGRYSKLLDKSFISDKMVLNKAVLREMKDEIESVNGIDWREAVLKSYPNGNFCGFSEFETYGTFILSNHRDKCMFEDDGREKTYRRPSDTMVGMREAYPRAMSLTVLK